MDEFLSTADIGPIPACVRAGVGFICAWLRGTDGQERQPQRVGDASSIAAAPREDDDQQRPREHPDSSRPLVANSPSSSKLRSPRLCFLPVRHRVPRTIILSDPHPPFFLGFLKNPPSPSRLSPIPFTSILASDPSPEQPCLSFVHPWCSSMPSSTRSPAPLPTKRPQMVATTLPNRAG